MRTMRWRLLAIMAAFVAARQLCGADVKELKERRQRAATAFSDGVLLLHSKTTMGFLSDGYREEAAFYYLTGLQDSPGTMLAIVGKSGESWLFVPVAESKGSAEPRPGQEAAQEDLRDHFMDHPVFKTLDTYQWILLTSAHMRRHTAQILEVKADPNFPKR